MEVTLILGNLFKMFGIWKIKWWNSRVAYACNLGPREGGAGKINIEANLCYTARTCLRQTSKSKHDRLLPLCRRAGLYLGASIVLLRFRGLGGVSLPAPCSLKNSGSSTWTFTRLSYTLWTLRTTRGNPFWPPSLWVPGDECSTSGLVWAPSPACSAIWLAYGLVKVFSLSVRGNLDALPFVQ